MAACSASTASPTLGLGATRQLAGGGQLVERLRGDTGRAELDRVERDSVAELAGERRALAMSGLGEIAGAAGQRVQRRRAPRRPRERGRGDRGGELQSPISSSIRACAAAAHRALEAVGEAGRERGIGTQVSEQRGGRVEPCGGEGGAQSSISARPTAVRSTGSSPARATGMPIERKHGGHQRPVLRRAGAGRRRSPRARRPRRAESAISVPIASASPRSPAASSRRTPSSAGDRLGARLEELTIELAQGVARGVARVELELGVDDLGAELLAQPRKQLAAGAESAFWSE